ncbi:hypothetical protein N7509_007208 [Penicillium cosmopolitanum]|uniref:Kinetochore protein fta4 n=1 Tax=Penicillium cosmopolitanum TaxID=1131564 RepID=A0A9X0B899_9EURO|nr:uncharacterized protein N7509_007208 [Penicillium cosmopolitanum]KAJ5391718.1 hypothetical protein N7509_007208 [Penicillium cosmopolitanum]
MDSTRTIYELKSTFIRSQIRILSESLELPEDWQQYAVETEEGQLSAKAIEDVLHKVNAAAKQHHRVVYTSQAIHHVASQIASLYWSTISQEAQTQAAFAKGVGQLTDLSKQWNITKLPLELEAPGVTEEQNTRYQDLRKRLTSLDEQRQKRQRRRDQLQHLRRLLEPFEEPPRDIQPNLVNRDGDLIRELEKMRMLVARVGGRIAQQKNRGNVPENEGGEYLLPGSDQRLEALLDTSE